jgi:hypothetical protein
MPMGLGAVSQPEGALISVEAEGQERIAVVYEYGETPPEITITQTNGHTQTVCANGVAIAIVACTGGPRLSVNDVVLVERYNGNCG